MYPEAKIPVLQLSIDYTKGPQYHYDFAKELICIEKERRVDYRKWKYGT